MGQEARRYRRMAAFAVVAAVLLLGAAACGDDDSDGDGIEFRTPTPGETATVGGQQPPPAGSPTTPAEETESPPATESPGASPGGGGTEEAGTVLRVETTDDDPLAFDVEELTAPADTEVMVEYANNSSLPHNIHFFEGEDASAPSLAMTEIATGPDVVERVTFTTPAEPGNYYFQCDVHPTQMQGELVVE